MIKNAIANFAVIVGFVLMAGVALMIALATLDWIYRRWWKEPEE